MIHIIKFHVTYIILLVIFRSDASLWNCWSFTHLQRHAGCNRYFIMAYKSIIQLCTIYLFLNSLYFLIFAHFLSQSFYLNCRLLILRNYDMLLFLHIVDFSFCVIDCLFSYVCIYLSFCLLIWTVCPCSTTFCVLDIRFYHVKIINLFP